MVLALLAEMVGDRSTTNDRVPHDWLTRSTDLLVARLGDAVTPASVAIAAELGFTDERHLASRFCETYGCTPAAFRQRPAR